ncbi:TetR/AcrR family transcriptional regulator [Furfurilactobacillus siliginis]|uniref:HTH tetR-type domain-containing protein n=1 Tax=Furfurilactobacillus siliginis TaxID=348151 RepID=A0A0R2L9T1_9LACO|nr:TetR family transcriptional regulator [Furfurilactobacillus siliginis]KRN95479.1 hypothetical protein IV55_GL001940 [Furfurilactobacillus siliginis]GEK28253.1 hypothetical protein LSI01_05640 [Furfurilactobacillus siliginis]
MKLSAKQQTSRQAQRVLHDFSLALRDLLPQQEFERMTVNDLCTAANYPRSTFYNYFEDKYDLLNYAAGQVIVRLDFDALKTLPEAAILVAAFDRIYQLIDAHRDYVTRVLTRNAECRARSGLSDYLLATVRKTFVDSFKTKGQLPTELLIDHCFATILLVLRWIFVDEHDVGLDEAHRYLASLYGTTLISGGNEIG